MTDRTRSWLGLLATVATFLCSLFTGSYWVHRLAGTWLFMPVLIVMLIVCISMGAMAFYHGLVLLEKYDD
jgi:hypothetical protein